MFVIVQHRLTDPPSAFARGERLKRGEGAPGDTRVLQFYPSQDGKFVTCLWESNSVDDVQRYVDETLGDASVNVSYRGRVICSIRRDASRHLPPGDTGCRVGPCDCRHAKGPAFAGPLLIYP